MTRMNEERDSVLRIHAKVDSFDEWKESMAQTPTPPSVNHADTRIILCSPQKLIRVIHFSIVEAHQEFKLNDFSTKLAKFFKVNSNIKTTRQRLEILAVSSDSCLLVRMG